MKLMITLLLLTNAHADDDYLKLGQAEVRSAVETALHDGSTAALNVTKDGIHHFSADQEEWEMLFAAKKSIDDQWKMSIEAPEYEVAIGAPEAWNGNPNHLSFPITVRVVSHRFKAPVCLDYRIELQGQYIIYRSDDGQQKQRGIRLKSFTPEILREDQCV